MLVILSEIYVWKTLLVHKKLKALNQSVSQSVSKSAYGQFAATSFRIWKKHRFGTSFFSDKKPEIADVVVDDDLYFDFESEEDIELDFA